MLHYSDLVAIAWTGLMLPAFTRSHCFASRVLSYYLSFLAILTSSNVFAQSLSFLSFLMEWFWELIVWDQFGFGKIFKGPGLIGWMIGLNFLELFSRWFYGWVNLFWASHLFFKGIFLKMVNDVVRVPSVNLLDKLAKINYLYTHTHTHTH